MKATAQGSLTVLGLAFLLVVIVVAVQKPRASAAHWSDTAACQEFQRASVANHERVADLEARWEAATDRAVESIQANPKLTQAEKDTWSGHLLGEQEIQRAKLEARLVDAESAMDARAETAGCR